MRGVLEGGVGIQNKTKNHVRDVKIRGGREYKQSDSDDQYGYICDGAPAL